MRKLIAIFGLIALMFTATGCVVVEEDDFNDDFEIEYEDDEEFEGWDD